MKLKIGAGIAELRHKCGMTQEQLADALGVSAPAVSKWETDSSYPDITMLCPLARALGVDVNTLLEYEKGLTEEQAQELVNPLLEQARKGELEEADRRLLELLHQYPTSIVLSYHAAAVISMFEMFGINQGQEQKENWKKRKIELLQKVYEGGDSPYRQSAILTLATMAVAEEKLDRAEELMRELPEHMTDTTFLKVQLRLKKEQYEAALEIIQKRLYALVHQLESMLAMMVDERVMPDTERAVAICGIYKRLEEIFCCGNGMENGLFVEVYKRAGKKQEMVDCMVEFAKRLQGNVLQPNITLFFPAITVEERQRVGTEEMKAMLFRALTEEETYEELRGEPKIQEIIEMLRSAT